MTKNLQKAEPSFFKKALTFLGLVLLLLVVLYCFWKVPQVFFLTFVAILIAVLLSSAAYFIPLPYNYAIALTLLLSATLLLTFALFLGPEIASELRGLTQQLPQSITSLEQRLSSSNLGKNVLSSIPFLSDPNRDANPNSEDLSTLAMLFSNGFTQITSMIGTIASALGSMIFALLMGIFLAASPDLYTKGFVALFPPDAREKANEILSHLYNALQAWLTGQFFAMFIVGIIVGIGLWILGVPFALGLAFITFVLEFIPTIGPWLAAIPALLMASTLGFSAVLWILALFLLVEFLEGNLLLPLIQRRTVDLQPAVTLFAIFLMGSLYGILGVLVAAPLAAIILTLIKVLYLRDKFGEEVNLPG